MVHSANRAMNEFWENELLDKWLALCAGISVKGNSQYHYDFFKRLVYYYKHPGRYYRTLDHIRYCLVKLDEVRELVPNPYIVELAIWFHNAIYKVWADDNEEGSADLAIFFITKLMGLDTLFAMRVGYLVKNSAYFKNSPKIHITRDAEFFLDIDLSWIGDTEDVFDRNNINVKREFDWMDPGELRIKQIVMFDFFLKREPLYLTEYFRDKYEAQARVNIGRAIRELTYYF